MEIRINSAGMTHKQVPMPHYWQESTSAHDARCIHMRRALETSRFGWAGFNGEGYKMSEAKFTKGPWMADVRIGCVGVYQACREDEYPGLSGNDGRSIFFKSGFKDEKDEWCVDDNDVSNAYLIAAAPEMYEMLKEMSAVMSHLSNEPTLLACKRRAASYSMSEINDLLAKARGEKV